MKYFQFFLIVSFGCFFVGCGGSATSEKLAKYTEKHIQKATTCYTIYSAANRYVGPEDREQLVEFFKSDSKMAGRLELMHLNVHDIDSYFVSPRDGEEYKIRWKLKKNPTSPPYPIVFEQVGIDGTRLVGVSGGIVEEVEDDSEYSSLWEGKYTADSETVGDRDSIE